MPMMAVDLVPTQYASNMRTPFMVMLGVLACAVVGKFLISDFWGGISLVFVVLMGSFVLSGEYGINVVNCLFYAVIAIISGVFDVISCVMYFQHSKYKAFDTKAPTMVLVAQCVFIFTPIVLFASGTLAYSIYSDCRQNSQESAPLGA